VADGVPATVHQVAVDHPATGARLQPAGQLDDGDELVMLIDASVGQQELGQGEQQLATPLNRGSL
jgi:hypothetical protein